MDRTGAHLQMVKVGARVGGMAVIEEGLRPDERVIVDGFTKVREEHPGKPPNPRSSAKERPHVKILHQPAHRRNRHRDPDRDHGTDLPDPTSGCPIPQHRSPRRADYDHLCRRGRANAWLSQSVAAPIEQQMSGVDNLNYMFSVNGSDGSLRLTTDFDVATDPNTDLILSQMRVTQALPQLPADVAAYGVTVQKSLTSPLMLVALYSPHGTFDSTFLANYAYINLNDQLTRVPGIGSVTVFGAGQYALRYWIKPDQLAKLKITVGDVISAIQSQNTVNPAGQIGAEPALKGQQFTYSVRAQGRLTTPEEFGQIVLRENPDGSLIRLKDVARVELGAQLYNVSARLNGRAGAIIAIYQLPGSNALDAARGVEKAMKQLKQRFPADIDYMVALDTTRSVSQGVHEISQTLWQALALVVLVVFIFLQGWRATVIPLLAVPVSLIGTFALSFPLFGFSVNTLSLFGLVLAIGLVVDDAIVVVEAVERHIEEGMTPRNATLQAMSEVSGPVIAIALILAAVFVPTAFIPGITGRLYQQFALTIAISVIISAFNALSLSPALCALLLRPRTGSPGPLGRFYSWFNRGFGRATEGYVGASRHFDSQGRGQFHRPGDFRRRSRALFGSDCRPRFLPNEDQGYMYVALQLVQTPLLWRGRGGGTASGRGCAAAYAGSARRSQLFPASACSAWFTALTTRFFSSISNLGRSGPDPRSATPVSSPTSMPGCGRFRTALPSDFPRRRFPVLAAPAASPSSWRIAPGRTCHSWPTT